ncbi:hypothetical protein KC867_00095 [Candidatus Saccharibacteria bacterium]|nr:hypothetical protein [Candidatus Saccharibacteria bacterium]
MYFSFPVGSDSEKCYNVIAAACDFATTLYRESQRSRQAHPAGVGVAKQKPRYKNVAQSRRK